MLDQRTVLKLWLGTCLALCIGACQAIAGIEERKADVGGAGRSDECADYCSRVMVACTSQFQVYISEEVCLGLCSHMQTGDPLEPISENTVACRARQAELAELEPDVHCMNAGPGGNGECGSDCEAYCQLQAKTCPDQAKDYPTLQACEKACSGLTDQQSFDIDADHEGDTIECRLVHISSAAIQPDMHCQHAPLAPGGPWCVGNPEVPPTCEEYCNIQIAACGVTGELSQYESKPQCLQACAVFEPGTHADRTEDTIGCRRYHAFNATRAPTMHCSHSGPSGDGHCGDVGLPATGSTGNCDSYCQVVKQACPEEFLVTYRTDASCTADCVGLDDAAPDKYYTVAAGLGTKGLHCRLLHAVRGFEDPDACGAAVGASPCE